MSELDLLLQQRADPLDKIRIICDYAPDDALSRIAEILGDTHPSEALPEVVAQLAYGEQDRDPRDGPRLISWNDMPKGTYAVYTSTETARVHDPVDVIGDVVRHGVGITQNGKRIAPEDFYNLDRDEQEAARVPDGEVVYRWQSLDYSGYCYGSNPPDVLPEWCNLKPFFSDSKKSAENFAAVLRDIAYSENLTATPKQFSDYLQRLAKDALAATPSSAVSDGEVKS